MSGLAGHSPEPVVLPLHRLELVIQRVRLGFGEVTRFHDTQGTREKILAATLPIPFSRADDFRASVNDIVNELQEGLDDNVPRAILTAQRRTIATIRADLAARVQAGEVVLR